MLPSLELIKRDMRTEFSKQIPAILPIKIIKAIKEIEKKYAKAEIAPATTYIKDLFFTVKEAYTKSNPSVIFSKDVKYLPFILDFKVANEERIIEDTRRVAGAAPGRGVRSSVVTWRLPSCAAGRPSRGCRRPRARRRCRWR